MWVPGSESWVFVEIGGLRKMSVGIGKCRFSNMSGSIFARSGQSRLAFFDTYFIKMLNSPKFQCSHIFSVYYYIGVGGMSGAIKLFPITPYYFPRN